MLLLLVACSEEVATSPPVCAGWDEIEVTNPDGTATSADFAAVEETLAAFASWIGGEPLCVGEVRLTAAPDADEEIQGRYTPGQARITVGVAMDDSVREITTHELCHAWDARAGFSDGRPDLFPPDETLPSEYYPTERARSGEVFALRCDDGPPPRAVTEAVAAACADADPVESFLLSEVFPAYVEEVPVAVAGGLTVTRREVPLPERDAWAEQAIGSNGQIAVLYGEGSQKLAVYDVASESWSDPVAVPDAGGGYSQFVDTLPDALPVVRIVPASGEVLLLELRGGELADLGLDWLPRLLEEGASLTLSGEEAVWQVWGDGEPLQQRARAGGEATAVPGDDGRLALSPMTVAVAEGQLVGEYSGLPQSLRAYALTPTGLSPFPTPVGVDPVAALPDGGVLAQAGRTRDDGVWVRSWVVRDGAGEWRFPPASCGIDAGGEGFVTVGGRVFATSPSWGALSLDEIAVE